MDKTIAIDTSVALALLVAKHSHHRRSSEWTQGMKLSFCVHSSADYGGRIAMTAVENKGTLASLDRRAVDTYFWFRGCC